MAFKFAAYETLKQMHRAAVGGRSPSMPEDFCLGATAGACAAAATTPLDVIKTNMMCTAAGAPSFLLCVRSCFTVMHAPDVHRYQHFMNCQSQSCSLYAAC